MGLPQTGLVCHLEQEMPELCQKVLAKRIHGQCFFNLVVQRLCKRLPPISPDPQGPKESETLYSDSHCSSLAMPVVAHRAPKSICTCSNSIKDALQAPLQTQWRDNPPRPLIIKPDRIIPDNLEFGRLDLKAECRNILAQAQVPETTKPYNAKWKHFCV